MTKCLIVLVIAAVLLIGLPMIMLGVMWHDMWSTAATAIHEQHSR